MKTNELKHMAGGHSAGKVAHVIVDKKQKENELG